MCMAMISDRTGFPGLTSAMERGIHTACAAANLNNPETIAAVNETRFGRGCFTIQLARLGTDHRFCNERDIFEYLVTNYCDSQRDGVLPSAMGSLEFPPNSWMITAHIVATVGMIFLLFAWFFPRCCKNAVANGERCATSRRSQPPASTFSSCRVVQMLNTSLAALLTRRLCCRDGCRKVCLCPHSCPTPCACCPCRQCGGSKNRRALEDEYMSQLPEQKSQSAAAATLPRSLRISVQYEISTVAI